MICMEISAGVVIFRKESNKKLYLLLQYTAKHWHFPKGHVEERIDTNGRVRREKLEETALRELKEETGIEDIKLLPDFKEEISYFFKNGNKTISKKVVFFLAETKIEKVRLSFEHISYKWLTYNEALEQTTYKNVKQVLEKANKFLGG